MAATAGITARDKELARKSWIHVEKDYMAVGNALFTELFTAYPDYMKFFEKMKSSPEQNLFESARFKKHISSALFPAIGQMLQNLDAEDRLMAQLEQIGRNHKKRNLTRQNFEVLQKTILFTLKKLLGELLDDDTAAAWDKLLTVSFNVICNELDKH